MTLASLLGVGAEDAAQLLERTIDLRWDPADEGAQAIALHLQALLSRTVREVTANASAPQADAAIIIGAAASKHSNAVRVTLTQDEVRIGVDAPALRVAPGPKILSLVAACYAAGMAIKAVLGLAARLPGRELEAGLVIPTGSFLGEGTGWTSRRVHVGQTHLAGAGAIGNAFLYALALFDAAGEITVVDHDVVSDGNLNRCLFFDAQDVGKPKAIVLAQKAAAGLPAVHLTSQSMTLGELGKASADSRWLKRLVVGVDSPRVRRSLQAELPQEVFDASTTGALECVFHHHLQPTDAACLACIYYELPDEQARERHIADSLGVTLAQIKERQVSAESAERIHERYPHMDVGALVGQSYDSLFKAFCGQGHLAAGEAQQVLAPLAFVSVLAGTYLAIEFARRLAGARDTQAFNYWRLSAWDPPVDALKSWRPRHPECSFCGQPALFRTIRRLWP